MALSIRPIEKEDMSNVIALLRDNLSAFEPDTSQHSKIWQDYSSQSNVFGWVALYEDEVVGYGSVVIETKIRGGKIAHIEDICASSMHRRMGVGRKILQALLETAKVHGCYKAALACQEHNIDFYKANDYGVDGVSMSLFL